MLNDLQIASEFPLNPDLVYLNHAAIAPWPLRTTSAMIRFAEENCRYGASRYTDWMAGMAVSSALQSTGAATAKYSEN